MNLAQQTRRLVLHMMRLVPRLSATILLLSMALPLRAACPDAPTFTPAHYQASGTNPYVGVVRDFNGDGRGDLVVFHDSSSGFQVFLGTASGTLQPLPVQFGSPLSDRFYSLGAGDINGDQQIDVIANVNAQIRVYYGNGTGIFTLGPTLNMAGCSAIALTSRDFDGDGRSDIAALTVCGHLRIFRQTGVGTFAPPTDTPVSLPNDMEIGDVDGDGRLDVVAISGDNKVTILFGNGNGTFASSTIDLGTALLEFYDSVAIHDVDADGVPDLAVGVVNRGVQILTNNGNGTFALGQLLSPEGGSVRFADFNYDGITDVFASGYGGFYVVLGNGDGTFRAPQFTAVPPLGTGPAAVRARFVLGDFRGLYRVDVATTKLLMPQTIEVDLNDCGPPPVLTSVVPSSGASAGGNTAELHGANLVAPQQVLFGSTPATIVGSTAMVVTVVVPAHSPRIVPVSITTPNGTGTLNDAYTFIGPTTTSIHVAEIIAASRPYILTATITPTPNGGTVTFLIDGVSIGTADVNGGVATFTTIAPATLGIHTITAQFSGTSIFEPSSGNATVDVAADIPSLSSLALALLVIALAVCGAIVVRV